MRKLVLATLASMPEIVVPIPELLAAVNTGAVWLLLPPRSPRSMPSPPLSWMLLSLIVMDDADCSSRTPALPL